MEGEAERAAWLDLVRRRSGALTGAFGPGYVADRRDEWPD
jgi:hypothetical protein